MLNKSILFLFLRCNFKAYPFGATELDNYDRYYDGNNQ